MNRRRFLQTIGVSATVAIAGCASGADGPHKDPDKADEDVQRSLTYEYEKENYYINAAYMSHNAPDQVGVTARIISEQFEGETIPVEFEAIDRDGNTVFHEPVVAVGLDGGSASVATAWFDATEEQFEMDLYPKVRLRDSPPE